MIYNFHCLNDECTHSGREVILWRKIEDCGAPASCDHCGDQLHRIWSGQKPVVHNHSGFNHGLGIPVHNKDSIKDEIKRIKDTTGREVVEIGDSKPSVKKKDTNYNFTRSEYYQMKRTLEGGNV